MILFIGHLEVDPPPAVVFELLADMADLHRWNPNVQSSRRVSGDRLTTGSMYHSVIARGPMRMTAHSELVVVDQGRKVEYRGTIARFWSVDSLEFEASGGGTLITFRNETTVPSLLRPLTPLMNAAFQRQAQRAVDGAARYVAAEASA